MRTKTLPRMFFLFIIIAVDFHTSIVMAKTTIGIKANGADAKASPERNCACVYYSRRATYLRGIINGGTEEYWWWCDLNDSNCRSHLHDKYWFGFRKDDRMCEQQRKEDPECKIRRDKDGKIVST